MNVPTTMRAMVFTGPHRSLELREVDVPTPTPGQVLVRVHACGVCRTDLHIIDGELPDALSTVILGHEVVGEIVQSPGQDGASLLPAGTRVGGRENLCASALFTGYHVHGGYAEYALADARYVFPLPPSYDDVHAAPLLCAGLIGYRAYAMAGDAQTLGLYGFGAAAHLVAQVALAQGRTVFAFTRPGDREGQAFARRLGAHWAGGSDQRPPTLLDAALLFAPAGALVPAALGCTTHGGTVICAGIHMTDIPPFPYALLWGERSVRSVANLTRRDAEAFLTVAAATPLAVHATPYAFTDANAALADLRNGKVEGAAVLTMLH